MQNRLQELTNKLYSEGLTKGKEEADQIISKAKEEAKEIIANANRESDSLLQKAKSEAEELRQNIESEVKMAFKQSLVTIKQQIEEVIVTSIVEKPVTKAMEQEKFFGEVIKEAVASFNPEKHTNDTLEVLLPENRKEELNSMVQGLTQEFLNQGVSFSFSSNNEKGFEIHSKEEGYFISFTDEQFTELIAQYIQPSIHKFLFEK